MPGKKIMMVLPPRDFDGEMFERVRRVFIGRRHEVSVTSVIPGTVVSDEGVSVPVDVRLQDLKYYQYDAFVFIGGEGAKIYFDEERVRKLADDVKFKTMGATGIATVILARSNALKNKKATGPHQFAGLLIEHGAVFTNQPLAVDDKMVTAQDASVAEQFANAVADSVE